MNKQADSKHDQYLEDVELWDSKQLGASILTRHVREKNTPLKKKESA
jgi:hypothetical protein